MTRTSLLSALALTLALVGTASAQTAVTLPDSSQTTTLTATVPEQARINVPSGITFNVTNIGTSTAASAATVTIDNIVLATGTKQVKLSIKAGAASFTPPAVGAATWSAGDVTWNNATWTNGSGAAGTLSSASFLEVATAAANAGSMTTSTLTFTLGANSGVKRSGNHTLSVTWMVEAIGT
jgi:hypothetical protein